MSNAADVASPLLYDSHMHTPLCKHAVGTPGEYAAQALTRGLHGIVITCHNPIPDGISASVRMAPQELETYVALVNEATQVWSGKVDILLGLESDFFPGAEPWLKTLHAKADFHYILGSVHPHLREYRAQYDTGDALEFQKTYFRHLAEAAETGLFDALAHPDLVKNCVAATWAPQAVIDSIRASLDRIAATGIAMELNTSGANKTVPEMNPGPIILREISQRGIPVVLGSDAHEPGRVADRFPQAMRLLQECGFEHLSRFHQRERREVSLESALAELERVSA